MSAPCKPWEEKEFAMNQSTSGAEPIFGGTLGSQSAEPHSTTGIINSGARPFVTALGPATAPPPPLPNRSHQRIAPQTSSMQPYSRYPSMYSNFGMGAYPYNSYSGYGGYPRRVMGGYGMGYSGFGNYQDDFDASMMQAIDESCQTLFGPFDALVRSIGSIAMVLDSTHQAMQFSFRTVLSAADSLSKLKSLIMELASSFSIIRLIQSLYYKVLRLLGFISGRTVKEKEWSELFNKASSSGTTAADTVAQPKPSPWLALGFFSLMMGGPYLMFRLFAQNIKGSQPGKNDLKVGNDYLEAIATYDFDGSSPQELSMKRGDHLKVCRSNVNQSWALASNGVSTGFIPTNRLQLIQSRLKVRRPHSIADQRIYMNSQGENSNSSGYYIPQKNRDDTPTAPLTVNKTEPSETGTETKHKNDTLTQ